MPLLVRGVRRGGEGVISASEGSSPDAKEVSRKMIPFGKIISSPLVRRGALKLLSSPKVRRGAISIAKSPRVRQGAVKLAKNPRVQRVMLRQAAQRLRRR